jgi:hypothetical protein
MSNKNEIEKKVYNFSNNAILNKALNKSFNVGLAGYGAMAFQVGSLMWLRTTMNYQFKNGGGTFHTFKKLYAEGGIPRFYRGVGFALINAPLSRFGDTAANMTAMTYLEDSNLNKAQKTFIGSIGAGFWRLTIIPVDSFKSHMQVHGKDGLKILKDKIKLNGYRSLYNGSFASFSGTVVGHFPWFYTYNYLQENAPYKNSDSSISTFLRSGCIGFLSSASSDIVSNSVRVLKISKQTAEKGDSYSKIVKEIIKKDNISGLFLRGLQTKLMLNGIQGFVFVVIFDRLKRALNV